MTVGQRITGYVLAGVFTVALLSYVFGRIDGWLSSGDAAITQASRAQLQLHAGLKRWRAKLQAAERQQHQAADSSAKLANALRAALARGARTDTVTVVTEIARADSTAYAHCSVALLACQQRAASAEQETDSLAHRLEQQLKVRDHRCGIFAGVGPALYADRGQLGGQVWAVNISLGCRLTRLPFLP